MCEAKENHGNLTRREGWREELIKFMNGDKTTLTSEVEIFCKAVSVILLGGGNLTQQGFGGSDSLLIGKMVFK